MKFYIFLITLVVASICFFISTLFFFNSGMFDNDFELNETRAVDILKAIDDIPLIDVDSDDITFSHRAKLIQINESMIMVKIDNNVQTILIDNDYFKDEDDKLSDLVDDNHLIVVYEYSDDYSKMLVEVY